MVVLEPTVMEVLMRQDKLTQFEIADALGKDQAYVSMVMNGRKELNDEDRDIISRKLRLIDPQLLLTSYNPELRDVYRQPVLPTVFQCA